MPVSQNSFTFYIFNVPKKNYAGEVILFFAWFTPSYCKISFTLLGTHLTSAWASNPFYLDSPQLWPTLFQFPYYSNATRNILLHLCVLVAQLCPTLCNLVNCSPPASSVHGILQARRLEWIDFPLSRGSSQPRNWIQVSHIAGGFFTVWATRETQKYWSG